MTGPKAKGGRDSTFPDGGGPVRRTRPRKRATRRAALIDAPMAIASDGSVLVNLTHLDSSGDVIEDARRLMRDGHQVFIGVALAPGMRRLVMGELEDALADVVGRVGARLIGPRG